MSTNKLDIVLLMPGQGSQKVGMGRDLADAFPEARDVFAAVDEAVGAPLTRLMFEGPADELTRTSNAQPALLAHSAAVWAIAKNSLLPRVRAAAGHSLGEFSAYYAVGAFNLADAARVVRKRGLLMFEQGVARPGAMSAILGVLTKSIGDICAQATTESALVVPANYNSAEQVVISGEVAGVERAMQLAKDAGAKRVLPLPVSGAFHSPLMAPAAEGLSAALNAVDMHDNEIPVFANVDATPVCDSTNARRLLVQQLTAPVQWVLVMQRLAEACPGALFVEMGSGAVLSGLAKRIVPGANTMTCGTVAEVEALLKQVA
ncbi:MAG: ACP S-malonyltransferase [Gemmatimonadaceae bacterium]